MGRTTWSLTGTLLALIALAGAARGQDKLSLDKLPKPVVDAGQSMQPGKSYSRWKPVRDQMKTGEEIDPALAAIPEADRAKHIEARKIARLLVSEIKLYNEAKVDQGRKNNDIYERLKEDIDRSRQMYDERIPDEVRKSSNYFYDELVRILADGDATALGL